MIVAKTKLQLLPWDDTIEKVERTIIEEYEEYKKYKLPLLGFIYDPATKIGNTLMPLDFIQMLNDTPGIYVPYEELDWENYLSNPTYFWLVDDKGKLNRMVK